MPIVSRNRHTQSTITNASDIGVKESGVAMLELAIVAPLLLTLCIGVIDVSRMLLAHLTLTQYVREATRVASVEQGLEIGAYKLQVVGGAPVCLDVSDSPETNSPGTPCNMTPAGTQQRVLFQIFDLMNNTSSLTMVSLDEFTMLAEFPPNADMVRYTIRVPYSGFFAWFDKHPIVVASTGPYL